MIAGANALLGTWPIRVRSSGGYFGHCGICCRCHSRRVGLLMCAPETHGGRNADIRCAHSCATLFCRRSAASLRALGGSIVALLVNAFVATALGFVIYFRLIRTIGSIGTASVGYLKPAVGVLIGCTLMGEALTWTAVTGLLAILLGVAANQSMPIMGSVVVRIQICGTRHGSDLKIDFGTIGSSVDERASITRELDLAELFGSSNVLELEFYSITASAPARRIRGTTSPRVRAAFRLITSSNFFGACTGSSAGFAPWRMRST